MEVRDCLLARRSVRKFLDKHVEEEKIDALLEAAMSGPSAMNHRPWRFYVIKDKKVQEDIKNTSPYSKFNSDIMILVCGDLSKSIIPNELQDFWIQDASASVENILLRATDLGLGACWCGVFPRMDRANKIKEVIKCEDYIMPLALIQIGYPDESKEKRTQYEKECVKVI